MSKYGVSKNYYTPEKSLLTLLKEATRAPNLTIFEKDLENINQYLSRNSDNTLLLSTTQWSILNYLLHHILLNQKDANTLKKMTNDLYDLLVKHLLQYPEQDVKRMLSNRDTNGYVLLQHALRTDYGDILEKLIALYSQAGFENSLDYQLNNVSASKISLLQTALRSKNINNINKILSLLSQEKHVEARFNNLTNKDCDGFTILHDAFHVGGEIQQAICEFLLQEENKKALLVNLKSVNKYGYNILQQAFHKNGAKGLTALFKLMVVAYGTKANEMTAKLISHHRTPKQDLNEIEKIYASYDFTLPDTAQKSYLDKNSEALTLASASITHDENIYIAEESVHLSASHLSDNSEYKSETDSQDHIEEAKSDSANESSESMLAPCGGIGDKYLGGPIPELPAPVSENTANNSTNQIKYNQEYRLAELSTLSTKTYEPQQWKQTSLNLPWFKAEFYSTKGKIQSKDQSTFVIAGRKANALVPPTFDGRCILVLTEEDYQATKSKIPVQFDVLVLKYLKRVSHGEYTKLGLPTPRRLAVFLFAHHYSLEHFLMIDDNISKLKFNAQQANWKHVYQLMHANLKGSFCVSVMTMSNRKRKEGELGSKCFMVDMALLQKHIPRQLDIFTLFPVAKQADFWGEDYYMQLNLHIKARPNNQGYGILPEENICLTRSFKHTNYFASTGALAKVFAPLDADAQKGLLALQAIEINESISLLNQIIKNNIRRYEQNKRKVEEADLPYLHAMANRQQTEDQPSTSEEDGSEQDFLTLFQSKIQELNFTEDTFRPYQLAAMQAVGTLDAYQARLILPTGSGKTFVQCQLASIAYHCLKRTSNNYIIIVVPQIELVNQFYLDYLQFNKMQTTQDQDLRIPEKAIIKVSSHQQSCHVKTLLMNEDISFKTSVLIFCAESFNKFVEEMEYELPHVPFILTDEYHTYKSAVQNFLENIEDSESLVIGSTATPPADDPFKTTVYRYQRDKCVAQGYLAPVIADSLGGDFSKEKLLSFIQCLPLMLEKQYHPGLRNEEELQHAPVLKNAKGVIYFPNIEYCKMAQSVLRENNIACYRIDSKNNKRKQELATFLQSDQPGVLLAVNMLRIGFNSKDLAWAIIARNIEDTSVGRALAEQIIGRVMRIHDDKIGYVLCFDNVYQEIVSRILAKQHINLKISPDYLARQTGYYYQNNKWKVCGVDEQAALKPKYEFSIIPHSMLLPKDEAQEDTLDDIIPQETMDFLGLGLKGTFSTFFTAEESQALKDDYGIDLKSCNLLSAYLKSKPKRGPISQGLDRAMGELSKWVKEDVRAKT